MKQIARELSSLLVGEVSADQQARDFFSTDGSIFTIEPGLIIYPRSERDLVLTIKYFDEKARAGEVVGITARGKGTDQGGAALGDGVVLVFPAHMKNLVNITKETVTVSPGMIYAHLQGILKSHGRFLPPYPASIDFCTVGGAVANNSAGVKSIKYGSTRDYVDGIRVVLSNGDVISTRRLNKKELIQKKHQNDFEGHIYRALDNLLTQNSALLAGAEPQVSKNATGYDLWDIKGRDGSFDLSQLFVGSQGTLGVVSEITFRHEPWNPDTILLVGFFDSIEKASEAIQSIIPLNPSALEMVDHHMLDYLRKNTPGQIEGLVPDKLPQVALLVEFDDGKARQRDKKAKRVATIFKRYTYDSRYATDHEEQDALWKIQRGAAMAVWMKGGLKKALPIIEDCIVPIDRTPQFLEEAYGLLRKYKLDIAVWGHAGDANFHIQPFMNLSSAKDRGRIFDLADEFYKMVIKLGGSTSGQNNDGILRSPYLKRLYGAEVYNLFTEVKQIFDPLGILNPNVKLGVSEEYAATKLRREYLTNHLHDYLSGNYNK